MVGGERLAIDSWTYYGNAETGAGQVHLETIGSRDREYTYDTHGRVETVGGGGDYPVRYSYGLYGQVSKLYTYRDVPDYEDKGLGKK